MKLVNSQPLANELIIMSSVSKLEMRRNSTKRALVAQPRKVCFNSVSDEENREDLEASQGKESVKRIDADDCSLPSIVPSNDRFSPIGITNDSAIDMVNLDLSLINLVNKNSDYRRESIEKAEKAEKEADTVAKTMPSGSIWQRLKSASVNAETGKSDKFKALTKTVKMNLLWGKGLTEKIDKKGADTFVVNTTHHERLLFDKSVFKVSHLHALTRHFLP